MLKISDFGWSIRSKSGVRNTVCGTLDYLCPEMINDKDYNNKVDLWCLGVLIFEFCTGVPPFMSDNEKTTR